MRTITGAQAVVESLIAEGVEVVFGYPGGAVLPLYDVLYSSPLRHILTRHEQGAIHAADGYARATGKVGVCIATSGPGATNLVTGIANAYMDSIPVVAFTGQVATNAIGTDAFQEADITGITLPITKHNWLVKDVRELPSIIKKAFHIASTGRPGPVLIDLPKDVQTATLDYSYPEEVDIPSYKPTYHGHPRQIAQVVRALLKAEKPLLYLGGGVISSGASELVRRIAELLGIPVTTTMMGLGAFPSSHELSLGMLGMHGTAAANLAVTGTDLLVAVGARFDDRVTGKISTFAPNAKIIHIDIDPAEIGKNLTSHIPVVGDVKLVLTEVLAGLEVNKAKVEKLAGRRQSWVEQVKKWQEEYPMTYQLGEQIKPQQVIQLISELVGDKAVIATEVGQNQMWTAQYYPFEEPRTLISSGGLGTMGFGLPAAIGAQVGRPDKIVVDIAGDGSILMNSQEMATAKCENIPVKVVILNNSYLGMVRQWQEFFFDCRYSCVNLEGGTPDFVKLAEAYGWLGRRVSDPAQLKDVLAEVLNHPGPAMLDVVIDRGENVLPMVPPGGELSQMIFGKEGDK
ncbi:MAG: biosynthetic-type acetolactate synthase large subunit [Firmicutes bacterium]|jgi:acetolactate synthase-1/2/3 large subunit|nr:biosynthetic-type acetolactate synthase large subunit [Bacillota bacterium]HQD39769.1 biosynthetic-type acetolactate synthase large subunit [Bacillota bacterium]